MKDLTIRLINNVPLLQKLYIKIFNEINFKSLKYPGYYFRNNKIVCSKENKISFGNNNEIYKLDIICNGKNNQISYKNSININGFNIRLFGNSNIIEIDDNVVLNDLSIFVRGNSNIIRISNDCSVTLANFHIEQDNNSIIINKGTTMHGRNNKLIDLSLDESTKIIIDEDCMISNNVHMRTSDSHSIINMEGNRINQAKDIIIGKHCWIGLDVLILKGVTIAGNNVIAARSVCVKSIVESNVIIAGNPAKVIKRDIDWDRKFV